MSQYTIYGVESSPFVRKTLVAMAEKGLGWTLEEVNVFEPPDWFLAISPAKRIPVMRIEDTTLADSSAICGYLEKAHPMPALYPSEPLLYGQALWLEEYADTVLAEGIGFGLLRTLISAPRQGKPPDLERARKALNETLPPVFEYLDGVVRGRTYAVGETLSIADIALCAQLIGLEVTRVGLDAARWPALADYFQRILARDAFQQRLAAMADVMPRQPFEL